MSYFFGILKTSKMWNFVALSVLALVIIFITGWVHRWRNPKCPNGGVLPPGSMGLPLIGETFDLLRPSPSIGLHSFIKKRIQRYGPLFRTSVVGHPVVVSTDPEDNNFLLLQEGKSVKLWYMDSFSKLVKQEGDSNVAEFGRVHKYVRSITGNHFGHERLKEKLISQVEKMVSTSLQSWSNTEFIQVKQALESMFFDITAKVLISYDQTRASENIGENIGGFVQILMSIPLNIPGTTYHRCLKNQRKILDPIRNLLKERQNPNVTSSATEAGGDFLDQAVREMRTKDFMTDDFVLYLIFAELTASYESISSTLAVAIKLLSENPSFFNELQAEHDEILKKRENMDSALTWDEYKSMTFTHQVINESLRFGNVAPGFLRRATKNVKINGYTIPAGWIIMIATSAPHLSESTFDDPMSFNPHRWKELDPGFVSKNFMPFGGGVRQCPGAEFARAAMATFFHVFVTKYRWTGTTGGENLCRKPVLDFGDGIKIKLSAKA